METENDFKVKICPYKSCAKCAQKWPAFVYIQLPKGFSCIFNGNRNEGNHISAFLAIIFDALSHI